MSKLTFYTHPFSRARTVRWMLEELEVPYDTKVVDFGGSMKSPEYLAINPMGKVPAIVHDGVVVTETMAICAYLADQFPEKKLAPPINSPERGPYYRWLFFISGPFELALTVRTNNWEIREDMARGLGCGHEGDVEDTLEKLLEDRTYVCGDYFTAADLIVGSYLGWAMMQKQLESRPAFAEYVARVTDRPAARRAQMLDDELGRQLSS
ncbi:glutathione S-transferase family protein [Gilvimarinus sp. F26214L]|uniref:glutathione S-transferase family protein n=1 Tax=Gilvimarinus sp. DZF01 TaxID=3461371 RepID=UPI0040455E0C